MEDQIHSIFKFNGYVWCASSVYFVETQVMQFLVVQSPDLPIIRDLLYSLSTHHPLIILRLSMIIVSIFDELDQ